MTPETIYDSDIGFTHLYFSLRQKEGRTYTDEQVLQLPEIDKNHPLHLEWLLRKTSCEKLVTYLEKKERPLHVLEVGCGNGWLTHQLAKIKNVEVTGIDINFTELYQAIRLFSHAPNIRFVHGDIRSEKLADGYDCIVFAASVQYFPSLDNVINCALAQLGDNGEIHIIDSPFYKTSELEGAKERTRQHYHQLGFPEMCDHYFHHCIDHLKSTNYEVHQKAATLSPFTKNRTPFPWIIITKP